MWHLSLNLNATNKNIIKSATPKIMSIPFRLPRSAANSTHISKLKLNFSNQNKPYKAKNPHKTNPQASQYQIHSQSEKDLKRLAMRNSATDS